MTFTDSSRNHGSNDSTPPSSSYGRALTQIEEDTAPAPAEPAAVQQESAAEYAIRSSVVRMAEDEAGLAEDRPEFPWSDFETASSAFVGEPRGSLDKLRQRFVNADGSMVDENSDEFWLFCPDSRMSATLRKVRSTFIKNNFQKPVRGDLYSKQAALERKAYGQALERYAKMESGFVKRGQIHHHSRLQQQMRKWHPRLTHAIKEEQDAVNSHIPSVDRQTYGPYLLLLNPDVLAVITMHEVLSATVQAGDRGALFSRTALAIGKQVLLEVRAAAKLEASRVEKERKKLETMKGFGALKAASSNELLQDIRRQEAKLTRREADLDARTEEARDVVWDAATRVKLGGVLIGLMIGHTFIRNEEGDLKYAVEHDYLHNMDKTVLGILRADDALHQLVKNESKVTNYVSTRQLPMVVEPKPWSDPDTGGYLHHPSFFMRVRHSHEHKMKLREVARANQMPKVFKGLNALGATEWRINQPVFDVIDAVWLNGGGQCGLVCRNKLVEPDFPDLDGTVEWRTPLTQEKALEREEIEKVWRRQMRHVHKENRERHSLSCDLQLKLQVAKDFLHLSFYFPHNLDFRGRSYPIPPHLHHLGNDMCRGLLLFDVGKPLTADGLYWLKLHVANVWGEDKLSNEERVEFVEKHMEQVHEAASEPLHGTRWWMDTDDPFQLLAACIELSAALKHPEELGGPHAFVSHLPVHQDGSCNGLQHYAALSRDEYGAKQVNLTPSDKPQDVYTGVATILQHKVNEDLVSGDEDAKLMASLCHQRITRKIVKQTVMTSVYGVTFVGARDQIHRRLVEQGEFPEEHLFNASCYLARHVMDSVGDSFKGARKCMEYLSGAASAVGAAGEQVKWVTPLNLPIMQPYKKKPAKKAVQTVLQSVVIATNSDHQPFHKTRQRSAFAPNFVHSLDSSHMLLTAIECHKNSISFASVHDSFWTHAATVEAMNLHIREQFIVMHSDDLLRELDTSLKARYPEQRDKIPPLPEFGTLDLNDVKKSQYFFD